MKGNLHLFDRERGHTLLIGAFQRIVNLVIPVNETFITVLHRYHKNRQ